MKILLQYQATDEHSFPTFILLNPGGEIFRIHIPLPLTNNKTFLSSFLSKVIMPFHHTGNNNPVDTTNESQNC